MLIERCQVAKVVRFGTMKSAQYVERGLDCENHVGEIGCCVDTDSLRSMLRGGSIVENKC